MKLFYLLSVFIYSASVMGMPKKVSITPLCKYNEYHNNIECANDLANLITSAASEEEFGTLHGGTLQNIASMHDPYPIYVISTPYRGDERQRPNLNALRGLNIYDLPYSVSYPKRFVDKKSLDSIGGGHLI